MKGKGMCSAIIEKGRLRRAMKLALWLKQVHPDDHGVVIASWFRSEWFLSREYYARSARRKAR